MCGLSRSHPETGEHHENTDDIKREQRAREDQRRCPERIVFRRLLSDERCATATAIAAAYRAPPAH